MTRRGGMRDVELEDAPGPAAPRESAPARPGWRWRWVAGAAVVVAAALGGTQVVVDSRERAAAQRYASVPGVVAPVGSDVGVLWTPDAAEQGLVLEGIRAGGAFVGLSVAQDGSQAVLGVDARTGSVRWATSIFGADPARARSLDRRVAGRCAPVPGVDVTRVACLVSDGYQHFDAAASPSVVAARTTRVVVLDVGDGHIVADHPAATATAMAVLPGLAVLNLRGAGVLGQDLLTGQVRWRYGPPGAGGDLSQAAFNSPVRVFAAGDLAGVAVAGWSVTLLTRDGTVVREPHPADAGYHVDPLTGDLLLLATTGSGQISSTVVRAGRDDVVLPGGLLGLAVDDGSVPGLVLTADASLRGWDDRTGAQRWSFEEGATGAALVLRGRVYVPTAAGIVALDGRTGTIVWRTSSTAGPVSGTLATDGTSLLVASQPVVGDGRSELDAYGLDDGRLAWRAPLPAGVRSSTSVGRTLLGRTTDGVVVLG